MKTSRLSSWCLLAGILCGFAGAIWEGHRAAQYSKPSGFQRFSQHFSPDASFYPPFAMMETLAASRWQPGKTLVIIGGDSVLNGVSQPRDEVWSVRLQQLLGDSYAVVNLALRGATPAQGGALVAESLIRKGYPVIYVANAGPANGTGVPLGWVYSYQYWQALAQGNLEDHAPRNRMLETWLKTISEKERAAESEARLGGQLEAYIHFQSLWHHIAYRHFFTVWSFMRQNDPWGPFWNVPDYEGRSRPVEQRFKENMEFDVGITRGASLYQMVLDPAEGRWQLRPEARAGILTRVEATVPALRARMLMLLNQNAPIFRNSLTPEERARDDAMYEQCAQLLREHGVASQIVGADFTNEDFNDRSHLSVEGGYKIAEIVAKRIKTMPQP